MFSGISIPVISTCFDACNSWVTAACIRVADHFDIVGFPAAQLVEGAVGAAGVAGGGHPLAVHRLHHLSLIRPRVPPGHQGRVSAALQIHHHSVWFTGG